MRLILATLLLCCCVIAGNTASAASEDESRPNIIFLFADDQRADTIGAHGNPHIRTPNLDSLASEGFSFRRNYCAGSFSGAACVASRAMLMTGRHWMNLPDKRPTRNLGDSAVLDFLQSAGTDQPFFLYVAFMAPHAPRNPPEKYRELYYKNRPPLPANYLPQHPFRNGPQTVSGRDESLAPWPRTKEVISEQP